jgi:hypothetical protein
MSRSTAIRCLSAFGFCAVRVVDLKDKTTFEGETLPLLKFYRRETLGGGRAFARAGKCTAVWAHPDCRGRKRHRERCHFWLGPVGGAWPWSPPMHHDRQSWLCATRAANVGGVAEAAQRRNLEAHRSRSDRHGHNHATIFKSIRPSGDSSPSSSVM